MGDPRAPRCVLSGSCPQLLDVTLRASQNPVDHEGVGVGADLGCDPGCKPHQGGRQRLAEAEDPLQAGDCDLYSLPYPTPPLGWLGTQEDAYLSQSLPQFLAPVGQVSQEFASYPLSQSRLVDELLGQGDVGYVCRCELVGERDPVGGTDEVQLHPVDAEGTPSHPRRPTQAWAALRNLPGVQHRKQRRVDEQGLRIADHLGEDLPPQRLQEA